MAVLAIPDEVGRLYEIHDWRNALAILTAAHAGEWGDILAVLSAFRLLRNDVLAPGGRKSPIAE